MRTEKEELENVQRILQQTLGWNDSDVSKLALQARDLIWSDRQIIKILGRNIESLTMQMKTVTDVTFENDRLKENIEVYKDMVAHLKERLARYE